LLPGSTNWRVNQRELALALISPMPMLNMSFRSGGKRYKNANPLLDGGSALQRFAQRPHCHPVYCKIVNRNIGG